MEKSLIEMKERGAPFEFVSIGKIVGVLLLFCLLPPVVYSQQNISGKFTHGIASGDPDQFSVVLWTRFVPAKEEMNELSYEVSESRDFSQIKASGKVKSLGENNFCIKLIARELKPGTTYFYRFLQGDLISPIGRTKTLPLEVEKLRIGVVNCAKYTGGYYHAYDALAKLEDVDVVIHLGDYIYENGPSTPKSSYWAAYLATGRQHDPPRECLTLEDYRTRYAQYRSDSSLQKLHANFPMIPIWDDHEIAMKRHKQNGEGRKVPNPTWEKRRDNSIKAYHEWLPLRPEPFEEIYRSFQFGNLLNLLMLDTRVCCRSLVDKTEASLNDTSRHIIGNKQLRWIKEEVKENDAVWNVFGNQILISLKGRGWERWQGFPHDRERFLKFVEENPERNFLFTTGNAHNPHHYIVFSEAGTDTLLHEILPGSISSGNNAEKARFDPVILNKEDKRLKSAENVRWYHQNSHGFIVLDISQRELVAQWHFVSTIWEKKYETSIPYTLKIHSKRPHK